MRATIATSPAWWPFKAMSDARMNPLRTGASIRALLPMLVAVIALATSVEVDPGPKRQTWRSLTTPMIFNLGDRGCGDGWHQALWRDWRGDWWWGPCVPNR